MPDAVWGDHDYSLDYFGMLGRTWISKCQYEDGRIFVSRRWWYSHLLLNGRDGRVIISSSLRKICELQYGVCFLSRDFYLPTISILFNIDMCTIKIKNRGKAALEHLILKAMLQYLKISASMSTEATSCACVNCWKKWHLPFTHWYNFVTPWL